jgi:two-component system C4-dicarboxylate transport sensor histidine kinase DctB
MRVRFLLLAILATIVVATGVFQVSLGFFRSEEFTKAQGRLSLYRSTVEAELNRFSHLTFVLARDPVVIETAQGANTAQLNTRLAMFADQAGLDAIYLMGPDGVTIAASNSDNPSSFVGQDYGFRPYFQTARTGMQGRFYGIGATTGLPGYFIADSVATGPDPSVIAIKIDLSRLESSWQNSGEQVLLSNADGVVLLASVPAWRYRALTPLSPQQRSAIQTARQFPGQALDPLEWTQTGTERAQIGGAERLHLTATNLPHGWQLHYFAAEDPAIARAGLVTGAVVILAALALILFQVQRARRMGRALRRSVLEEAQLRKANERLAIEIDDRRTAERRLKRTQNELERTSRLAALGQLAASVTHELGQPIAAMRNHLAAAELAPATAPKVATRLGGLVDRMEAITRQLKFFARTGTDPFTDVDLNAAIDVSLELIAPNLTATPATIARTSPQPNVTVRGNRLRLEQVTTNLLRNALDAVEDTQNPTIHITIDATPENTWIDIADNGHGLGQSTLMDLQEPFVTTRESGRGMGLGLAISASIITDHNGTMTAWNGENGGAVFRVTFPNSDTGDTL